MKATFKKLTALTLVLALALSSGVLANAATASSKKTTSSKTTTSSDSATGKSYGLTVKSTSLLFTVGGKTTTTLPSKNANITIKRDANDNMLVSYLDKSGKTKSASLGKQNTLTISGTVGTLTLDKSLGKTPTITLAAGATAARISVAAPCSVKVDGKLGTLSVTGAANVVIGPKATVDKKIISSKSAKVTTSKKTSNTVDDDDDDLPKGKTLRMKIGTIELDEADYLENLEGELSDAVEVTIPKDDETMFGEFKWNSSGSVKVVDGRSYAFTFYPDDEEYEVKTGSIKVYIDRSHGDVTLDYKRDSLEFKEGARVSNLKSEMRKNVTAYDDDDNKVSGSFDFDESSSNTLTDGRTYYFTFKPSGNRYDECDGSITVTVVPK